MKEVYVPLVDLKAQHASIREELSEAIRRVLERGNYVMGDEVEAFEQEWARVSGAKYAVGVSSGSDALYLVLRWLREKWGITQQVTTPLCFWATVESGLRAGMHTTFMDVDLETGCTETWSFDASSVFVPVHLYGRPVGTYLAGAAVVEDASHAHGQQLRGWAACYSHYPTKPLGALGMAGSVVTDSEDIASYVRQARAHSEAGRRFLHTGTSGNFRIDELQAAVLRVKLRHLQEWNNNRRQVANWYRSGWRDKGLDQYILLQPHHPEHTYHILAGRVVHKEDQGGRDALADYLKDRDVQCGIRYPIPLHRQPAIFSQHEQESYPHAEEWARTVINFPCYEFMTEEQVEYVCRQVLAWCSS